MWGDESEAVAPIIWLYQIVDAQKEDVFFPDLLITLRSYIIQGCFTGFAALVNDLEGYNESVTNKNFIIITMSPS